MAGGPLENIPLHRMRTSTPVYSLVTIVIFVASALVLILTGHEDNAGGIFLASIFTTLPSLVAATMSERAARDIRNGVVEDKARAGAVKAMQNSGITPDTSEALRLLNESFINERNGGNHERR